MSATGPAQHPHSPALTRGVRIDPAARPDASAIDRTAPPLPLDTAADDIPAITASNDGTPVPASLGEWARYLYNALYTIAAHLLGHGNRLDHIIRRLADLQDALARPSVDKPLMLSAIPQRISDHAALRRHLLVYSGAAVANVVVDSGSVKRSLALNAGWTVLDPPGDTTIYTSDGSSADVYLRATDHVAPGQA